MFYMIFVQEVYHFDTVAEPFDNQLDGPVTEY